MFSKFSMKKIGMLPLLLALTLFAVPASALDLGQAKAQGLVKETASGYLVAAQPSAEVKALVSKINAGRKAEYQRIATKNGTPLSAVEQQAGKKLTR
ncbi:MAG: YdbL family protein [Pseudomonadota bacterium]|nr:YdbL family protein [Pseudomonadota bacterium]